MQYRIFKPSVEAQKYIHSFSYCTVESKEDFEYTGLIVPDGYPELYIFDGSPMGVQTNEQRYSFKNSFACRLFENSVQYIPSGGFRYWSIKLQPWTMSFLFNGCSDHTTDIYFDLESVFSHADASLKDLDDVWLYDDPRSAIHYIEKLICGGFTAMSSQQKILATTVHDTMILNGNVRIEELCKKMNLSRQYLERIYKNLMGLTPKQFSQVIRVRRVADLGTRHTAENFAQIAYALGFSDQSHMIRNFKSTTGITPAKFFKDNHWVVPV